MAGSSGGLGAGQFGQVALGHALLAACAVLYLAWWWVFFRPGAAGPTGALRAVGVACIVGAAALGVASVTVTLSALGGLPSERHALPGVVIAAAGAVAYAVLAAVTAGALRRPVTTELLLIVGWATMEAAVVSTLWATAAVSTGRLAALGALAALVFAASLICYVLYYRLGPWPSFVDGMVPLGSVGVLSAIEAAALAVL